MGQLIDLTGRAFNRWKVLRRIKKPGSTATYWLCVCSCPRKTQKAVAAYSLCSGTSRSCGCLIREAAAARSGPNSPSWKGGKHRTKDGYIRLHKQHGRSELEHRAVMEKYLGRKLTPPETVHHKNGLRGDNRLSNLELRYGNHGEGQKIEDLKIWAVKFLKLHAPELLKNP